MELFPQYHRELGSGLDSNILVATMNATADVGGDRIYQGSDLRTDLECLFFRSNDLISTSIPLQNTAEIHDSGFLNAATHQVVCPCNTTILRSQWDSIALMRAGTAKQLSLLPSMEIVNYQHPVCETSNIISKFYKLSACVAMKTIDANATVEWIEYHKMIGNPYSVLQSRNIVILFSVFSRC
jgi:hypothetical protein